MRNVLLASIAAAVVSTGIAPAHADLPIVSADMGIEGSTAGTLLPSTTSGSVVRSCERCRGLATYRLTPDTTYFIGQDQVTLAQLNTYAKAGTHALTIFVKANDRSVVTRIVIPRD